MIYPQIWNTSDNKNAIRETPKVNLFLSGKITNDDKINLEIKYSGKAKHPAILAAFNFIHKIFSLNFELKV